MTTYEDGIPSPMKVDMGDAMLSEEDFVHDAEAPTSPTANHHKRLIDEVVVPALDSESNKRQKTIHEEDEVGESVQPAISAAVQQQKKANHEQWDQMFARLVEYKNKYGDCLVPKRYAGDPKLGTWVETQRVQYKRLAREVDEASGVEAVTPNKRLNQERLAKLQSIGFAWSAKNARKAAPKTAPPASAAALADGGGMAAGGPSSVTTAAAAPKYKRAPSSSGDEQPSRGRAERSNRNADLLWEEMYQRLFLYKEKYGDCLVPRKYEADPKLGTWVETQRVLWNRDFRSGTTPVPLPEPASVLPHATAPTGFVEGKTPEEWVHEEMAKQAHHEVGIAGGATAEDAAELAATMNDQHHPHPMSFADDEQNAAMMAGVMAAAAAAAAEVVDDASLPVGGVGGVAGESLEASLKMPAVNRRLTQERKDKLDALGFVWSLRNKRIDDHWDEMFRQLVEYKNKHGDCLVPSRYEENLKLGKWVETQRYEFTKLQRSSGGSVPAAAGLPKDGASSGMSDDVADKPLRATNPRLTEERLRRLESIGFEWKVKHKMKRYYDKQWDQMFERLLKFKKETGHCVVPKRYPPDIKLGTWVHTQRIQYRRMIAGTKGKEGENLTDSGPDESGARTSDGEEVSFRLTEDRRRRLEEVGFVWSARDGEKGTTAAPGRITRNSYDDQWDMMFNRLVAYKDKYGNCLVPKRSKEDPKLGTWVDTQRVQYKKMKKKKLAEQGFAYEGTAKPEPGEAIGTSTNMPKPLVGRLTDERIRRLEEIGFVWSLRDDWRKHYDELIKYKKEHGHCNVPARHAANRRLGIWVSAQRQQYKMLHQPTEDGKKRPLTQERIDLLNKIGFVWTIRSRDSLGESWNQRLEDLRQYRAAHGHCLVPSRYPPNPELGVWVGTQRTQYRLAMKAKELGQPLAGSSMTDDRIRQLDALGFVWSIRGTGGGEVRKDPEVETMDNAAAEQVVAMEPAPEIAAHDPSGIEEHSMIDDQDGTTDAILEVAMAEI